MGSDLVSLALVYHAPRISGRAFKVLVRMAHTALDTPNEKGQPAHLYFAGWELLALVIGQDPDRNPDAAYEQVRRVLRELERAGLIERLEARPQTGRRQTFRLHLSPTKTEGQSPPKRRGSHHQNSGLSPAETEGPRKDLGQIEDLPQDVTPIHPISTTDRASDGAVMNG